MSNKFQNEDFKSSSELVSAGGTAAQLLNTTKIYSPKVSSVLELVIRKNNDAGTVAPTTSNDTTQGYEVGSRWVDTVAQKIYTCVSNSTGAAVWKEGGATVATGGVGDLDTMFSQTFETSVLGDFTQTGLTLDSAAPLNGTVSAKLTHQSAVNQSFKQNIAVPLKFRGLPMTVAVVAKSNATSGNVTILFRDETNNVALQSSSQINATSTSQTFQFGVTIPSTCLSFSYTITALPEAGSPITYIDDIVIRNYWMGTSVQGQTTFTVPKIETQNSFLSQATTVTSGNNISGVLTSSGGVSTIYSYNSGTGIYTVLKAAIFNISSSIQASGANITQPGIVVNGSATYAVGSNDAATSTSWASASVEIPLSVGDTFTVNVSGGNAGAQKVVVLATAYSTTTILSTDLVPAKAMNGSASIQVPKITSWQGYTPTFQGFGTPTNVEFEWRQVGEDIEVRGKMTLGTTTAVEARVGLPSGLNSAGTGLIPSIQLCGHAAFNVSSSTYFSTEVLIEPSVSYFTFSQQSSTTAALAKSNGTLASSGNILSFFAKVPCAGFVANETKTWSSTQTLVQTSVDSSFRADTHNGYGSTANKIPRFANIQENIGDALLYQDSSINGASFTALKSGTYTFNFGLASGASAGNSVGLSKNSSQLTTQIDSINLADRLVIAYVGSISGTTAEPFVSWTGYLSAGDVVRPHTSGIAPASNAYSNITAAYQGNLKVVNTTSDQKITLPTSELRFEGSSSKGSTDTNVVKFDVISKIRGDAFTVVNTAANGTVITVNKSGWLSTTGSLYATAVNRTFAISRNQTAALTTFPSLTSEFWTIVNVNANFQGNLSASGFVNAGDVFRVLADTNPTSTPGNFLNFTFHEQQIQVSVSNTLPQFSDSDSSVSVNTSNGFGSTNTLIRRFSNIEQNIGSDILYQDSSTLGGSFTVLSSGIYYISYTDSTDVAAYFGISKNATVATAAQTLSANERLSLTYLDASSAGAASTAPWVGYLNAGDVIRAHHGGNNATTSTFRAKFTISKLGKPNVTGVNVTPFINIPQVVNQSYVATLTSTNTLSSLLNSYGSGLFSVSFVSNRIRFTALKTINISGSGYRMNSSTAPTSSLATWYLNGNIIAIDQNFIAAGGSNNQSSAAAANTILQANEYLEFEGAIYSGGSFSSAAVSVEASGVSDTILTEPETFSTDTANLQYAGSGLYTLTTLPSAPIGTFITQTVASGGNIRTQTTAAPTQTVDDMRTNGIHLYSRAFNVSSTAALPAIVHIQIGKGLKGVSIAGYVSTGKTTSMSLDWSENGTTKYGMPVKSYNEVTGILTLDASYTPNGANTAATIGVASDGTQPADGYIVVNASKNPALVGFNVNDVAAKVVQTSAQSIAAGSTVTVVWDSIKNFDTHLAFNAATGEYTVPLSGYYLLAGIITWGVASGWTQGNEQLVAVYKNGSLVETVSHEQAKATASLLIAQPFSVILPFVKGDLITIRLSHTNGTAKALYAASNYLSIKKI